MTSETRGGKLIAPTCNQTKKINKPEELTLLYMNLGIDITTNHRVHNI
jgi:hypothetical protein